MIQKHMARLFLKVFCFTFLSPPAFAQLIDLCKFKSVAVPYQLKYRGCVIEKGTYDLESLKNPSTPMCYLRFKKGKEVICLVEGERLDYEVHGMDRMRDASIPDQCTLKMRKNPEKKVFIFIVETGRKNAMFPFLKLRFTMEYEE